MVVLTPEYLGKDLRAVKKGDHAGSRAVGEGKEHEKCRNHANLRRVAFSFEAKARRYQKRNHGRQRHYQKKAASFPVHKEVCNRGEPNWPKSQQNCSALI